jgi:hypothetical protein
MKDKRVNDGYQRRRTDMKDKLKPIVFMISKETVARMNSLPRTALPNKSARVEVLIQAWLDKQEAALRQEDIQREIDQI